MKKRRKKKPKPVLDFWLDENTYAKVQARAKERRMTISRYITTLLESDLRFDELTHRSARSL